MLRVVILSTASVLWFQASAYGWVDAPNYEKKRAAERVSQEPAQTSDVNSYPRTVQDFHSDGTLDPPRIETAPPPQIKTAPNPSSKPNKGGASTAW